MGIKCHLGQETKQGMEDVGQLYRLEKGCLKDSHSLPKIDKLADSTTNYELLGFIDAFLGYHQIPLSNKDKEKTSHCRHQLVLLQANFILVKEH